ncbi:hypothetical protein [Shouchella lehensis]|uniref:Restriction endonuclease n=1 Tax=Shouchella lehensis TaxID=300825 RepID=A0A4Y7WLF5_9BACI|nr:hypothetical protein [Shouchella lehensis]MBG9783124.1 hypothetical protein [Shouchella lehensis]TES49516.1 hypothetical protein E2L03_08590 [Shouchella lehensis]
MEKERREGIQVAVQIFILKCKKLLETRNPNIYMKGHQEKFSEWFTDKIPYETKVLGKNEHPDLLIQGVGFELKSKKGQGHIQFNSTIPSGRFKHRSGIEGECYYGIGRYKEDRDYGQLQDFCLCYGSYFNFDYEKAHQHKNEQDHGFGDYGDGVLRYRKMYTFPSPTRDYKGISLILDSDKALDYSSELILEKVIRKESNGAVHKFYLYRHRLLI